jgi:hypothetical protein
VGAIASKSNETEFRFCSGSVVVGAADYVSGEPLRRDEQLSWR